MPHEVGSPLEVVLRAGRDIAKDDLLSGPAAQEDAQSIEPLAQGAASSSPR